MTAPASVAVAILFFERAVQTLECIRSFLPANVPIYVLNNGSSVGQTRMLATAVSREPAVTMFHARRNVGVAAGRNRLVRRTREPWLFFADNDVTMRTPAWSAAFRAHRTAHPRAEVFVPRLFNVHDRAYASPLRLALSNRELRLEVAERVGGTNCFPGGACLVRRRLFERLGLFDERMFVGFQDWELAARALLRRAPVHARTIDDIELAHEHRAATSASERAAARVRYDVRRLARSHRRLTARHRVTFATDPHWVARQRAIVGLR
jgi:GT2 family glycosyltransferase